MTMAGSALARSSRTMWPAIELDIEHIDAFAVRDQVAPVLPLGGGQRRGDDLEVDGAVGVGEDEEFVAAVGDRILHAFLARRDEARRRFGIGQIDQALLGGFVVAAGDHAKAAAGALVQMGEPAGVLFFIDQDVVRLRRCRGDGARPASGGGCRRA